MRIETQKKYNAVLLELERMLEQYGAWRYMPTNQLDIYDTLQKAVYEYEKRHNIKHR